jgi:hypothetical protein
MNQTRREILEKCVALGAVKLATSASLSSIALSWDGAEKNRETTPFCELGPFYKRGAPQASMMRTPGDPGMPLSVAGVVYSVSGEILPNATPELWQTDNFWPLRQCWLSLPCDHTTGTRRAITASRVFCPDIIRSLFASMSTIWLLPRTRAVDHATLFRNRPPVFEGDPEKNFSRDPLIGSRELMRPLVRKGDPKQMVGAVTFDIVLEKARCPTELFCLRCLSCLRLFVLPIPPQVRG